MIKKSLVAEDVGVQCSCYAYFGGAVCYADVPGSYKVGPHPLHPCILT